MITKLRADATHYVGIGDFGMDNCSLAQVQLLEQIIPGIWDSGRGVMQNCQAVYNQGKKN